LFGDRYAVHSFRFH